MSARFRGKDVTTIINEVRWKEMESDYDTSKNTREFNSYGPYSNKKVWWICPKKHSYESSVCNRYRGSGCSYCSGRKVDATNCIAATHPTVAAQWNTSKNEVDITTVVGGSNKKYWWICDKGHEWEAVVNSRSKGSGCPHCNGNTAAYGNTLLEKYPDIAKEWHPTKNEITPLEVTPHNEKKVWWICSKGHDYEAMISNRTARNTSCTYCAGKKVADDTSFAANYPEIAKEWHPSKNDKTANEYSRSSGITVWWKCTKKHEWESSISNRVKGHSCPYCSGRLASPESNLAIAHPHLIKEWHTAKNDKKPEEYPPSSHYKVWWICSKNPKHEWRAIIANRTIGNKSNCPKCNMSKLELATEATIKELGVAFEPQKIFADLPQYRYDFFVPSWNTLIECDGIQHFDETSKFYKARTNAKDFANQQKSDKEKNEYALANNYNILRIGYTELLRVDSILCNYALTDKTLVKLHLYPPELYNLL